MRGDAIRWPKPWTTRAAALRVLMEHRTLTSAEYLAAIGNPPCGLNSAVRDLVRKGVIVRTPLVGANGYRYTLADGLDLPSRPMMGRVASVWQYAAGAGV